MKLFDLVESERTAIVGRWTDLALEVYPLDSSGFLRRESDRFRNPVGHLTREGLRGLFDGLTDGREPREMRKSLDSIVRVRAVQDLSPSQALGFVFLLKRAVRDVLVDGTGHSPDAEQLAALDGAVDRLALEAFDLFTGCRETIHRLRVGEIKRGAPPACAGALDPDNSPNDECGGCGA